MTTEIRPLRSHLKSRGVFTSGAVLVGGCIAVVVLSSSDAGLLSLVATGVTPLARLVTVLVGIAIAAPLTARFEADYMSPLRRDVRAWHLGAALSCSVSVGVLLAVVLMEPNLWALPRLVTFWTFLAIISATGFGTRLGWLLPSLISVGIALFSQPDATSTWNIVMSTQPSPLLWVQFALAIAGGSYCALR
ncbi:MAG: hypothetical protein EOL89_11095 [Actinobacteria bacterium]|nr:hypothetical protein [Actinomycetota bacterium]